MSDLGQPLCDSLLLGAARLHLLLLGVGNHGKNKMQPPAWVGPQASWEGWKKLGERVPGCSLTDGGRIWISSAASPCGLELRLMPQ